MLRQKIIAGLNFLIGGTVALRSAQKKECPDCSTKKNSWRAWTGWMGGPRGDRSELEKVAQAVVFRAEPLRKKNGWTAHAERYRVRENEAAIRAEWIGDAAPGPMRA